MTARATIGAGWLVPRLERVRAGVRPTTLAEVERTRDPFRLLVACVISLRTKDAVTAAASARLFAVAATPRAVAALPETRVAKLIFPAGFYNTKARQIREIARRIVAEHGGYVPGDRDALLAFPGVGRKTANLVLGLGFGIPAICVDTHVHRVSNRLGLVRTKTPEQTEYALEEVLPQRYWIEINDLMVTFGQQICQPVSPWCSRCPLAARCPRVGVTHSR
ncbi:MAG: endonuclease III [Acidobacteria bacterium 21-70-11]|nr:MAG: endonuclease III [Acidobacteria bacterium 21-70-11]HQU34935.1 endonuclease III [Thermoanaerobaculaceae bacterium]